MTQAIEALRKQGTRGGNHVFDADIRDYFGSIDQAKLTKLVERRVSDRERAGSAAMRHRHGHLESEHAIHGKLASLALFAVLLAFSWVDPVALSAPLLWGTAAFVVANTATCVRHGVHQYVGPSSAP